MAGNVTDFVARRVTLLCKRVEEARKRGDDASAAIYLERAEAAYLALVRQQMKEEACRQSHSTRP
jgi:hypothetical protein